MDANRFFSPTVPLKCKFSGPKSYFLKPFTLFAAFQTSQPAIKNDQPVWKYVFFSFNKKKSCTIFGTFCFLLLDLSFTIQIQVFI
jgi:hypothetical protein